MTYIYKLSTKQDMHCPLVKSDFLFFVIVQKGLFRPAVPFKYVQLPFENRAN